jgi:hypothetical protein
MDLQGTFGLVIPAFAETAALAVFLFVPFAAVHESAFDVVDDARSRHRVP